MLICRKTTTSRILSLTLLVALLSLAASVSSSLTMDTTPGWNGTNQIGSFGEPNTATYGQVITADATENFLDSFTFFLNDFLNPNPVDFEAYVYAWNGSRSVGPALFSSGPYSTTNNGGADGFEEITILTGGVELVGNAQYVLFFSASNLFNGTNGTATWGTVNTGAASPDTLPGGNFVFQNNGSNFDQLQQVDWAQRAGDLAFRAEFSETSVPIPEPGTAMLMGLGLVFLGSRRRA